MIRRHFLAVCVAAVVEPLRAEPPKPIRVALYADLGTNTGIDAVKKALAANPQFAVASIKAEEIRAGKLKDFDVVLFPGGSASKQSETLGEFGRDSVRAFVNNAGGFVGICAGAYLATCDYPWSLNILNAKVVDKKHWNRGHGPVEIAPTPRGKELLGLRGEIVNIEYFQGPLLEPGDDPKLPAFESLATFHSEIAENGAPTGVMMGTTAIAVGKFGAGRVLCFSPHPEKTTGLWGMLGRGVGWASGSALSVRGTAVERPGDTSRG